MKRGAILLCLMAMASALPAPAQAADEAPIRVGLIRADSHGVYYSVLMDKHDALYLRTPVHEQEKNVYTWLTGGYHQPFYTHYSAPARMTIPQVEGFEIVKVWDEYPAVGRAFKRLMNDEPEVCETFEEVSDGVDLVFIADCNYDGSDHLKLAAPGLRKGVATFVDKPLAYDVSQAKAIIALAKEHNALLYSSSILSEIPSAELYKRRYDELGEPQFGSIRAGFRNMAGQVHVIALALNLFGDGVESVESMGPGEMDYVHLDWGEKADRPRDGAALLMKSGDASSDSALNASIYNAKGMLHSPMFGPRDYPWGAREIAIKCGEMVRTKQWPASEATLLEPIAIATAARLSSAENRRVTIEEVLAVEPAPAP